MNLLFARSAPPAELLRAARAGSSEALGQILEACRSYLLLVANRELRSCLRGKVGASDLVQEAFAHAHRDFPSFKGTSEQQLLGWLRSILLHNLQDLSRRFDTDCRRVRQEVRFPPEGLDLPLHAPSQSPCERLIAQEQALALRAALDRLPAISRQVLHLRYEERLSFEQIGGTLGRSPEAARKLWFRAVELLRAEMGARHDP